MRQKISLATMMMIAIAIMVSCNNAPKQNTENSHTEQAASKKDCKDVHWSHHQGADGPENWANLCSGFAACGGQAQSPINIVSTTVAQDQQLTAPVFSYGKSIVSIVNNGHTIQFNVDGDNKVSLNGKDYTLLQFHYHALSEHTIDGKHFPLEVHFVHKHADNDFAVLGIMFEPGKSNSLLEKYLNHVYFPKEKGSYQSTDTIDLLSLFPQNKSYYYYKGSLTTPPCSEVVSWYVLQQSVQASPEQIAALSAILNNNYRPVMPLNGRTVEYFKANR